MPNVYTRTGDKGDTGLFGGSRVPKQSVRVEAYGAVDEANSAIGMAKAQLAVDRDEQSQWRDRVHQIQQRLFVLAAELASDAKGAEILADKIATEDVDNLERVIDDCLEITGKQRNFVVPGRDVRSAAFHQARTITRRAERRVLTLAEDEPLRPELIKYLNRLSDALFAIARLAETWAAMDMIADRVRAELANQQKGKQMASDDEVLARAHRLINAAHQRASEIGLPVCAAVVDAGGNLVAFERMSGSLLGSIEVAIGKAWSAAAFKMSTRQLGEAADGPLPGIDSINAGKVVLFGGGIPLYDGEQLVGGLGISGGTVEQDEDVMNYALSTGLKKLN